MAYHIQAFETIAKQLHGYTTTVVISFVDLYEKVKRNFSALRTVSYREQKLLGKELIKIASSYGMRVKTCAEVEALSSYGAITSGCMTMETYEEAIGQPLIVSKRKAGRELCNCYLSCDIGTYDTCLHLFRYCYANHSCEKVYANYKKHDPNSPFLIGNYQKGDIIHQVLQRSWRDRCINLFE